jgi:hypothetical protein
VAHHTDPLPQHLALAAASPTMHARLERLLATHWDPAGTLARALSARPPGPDPTRPRSLGEVARDVAGLLAAGGTEADVGGYLRREELAVLGPPIDEAERDGRGARRGAARAALWRAVRGIPRPEDLPEATSD